MFLEKIFIINILNKAMKQIYFLPRTKIGKISFWLAVSGVLIIIILNIISGLMQKNDSCDENGICYSNPEGLGRTIRIIFSLLAMAAVCISFITTLIAIIKYKDYALLLIIPLLLGLMGIMFVLGEFLVPH